MPLASPILAASVKAAGRIQVIHTQPLLVGEIDTAISCDRKIVRRHERLSLIAVGQEFHIVQVVDRAAPSDCRRAKAPREAPLLIEG